jgi:hypothetical protein
MEPAVSIEIGHDLLRQAVEAQLRAAATSANWEHSDGREIVISTTSDLSPDECRERTEHGAFVMILAAFPSHDAAQEYGEAGACYGAMTAGDTGWVECLRTLTCFNRPAYPSRP